MIFDSKKLTLLLGGLFMAVALHLFPFEESRVAVLGLERVAASDRMAMQQEVLTHCDSMKGFSQTRFERLFLGWIELESTAKSPNTCRLVVHSARNRLFLFKTLWLFDLHVYHPAKGEVLTRKYQLETTRPLCFLPLLLFILGIFLEASLTKLLFLVPTYLFFLSGANLIRLGDLAWQTGQLAVSHDQAFFGFAMLALWLAFVKVRSEAMPAANLERSKAEKFFNRAGTSFLGLWNPAVFTLLGQHLFPPRGRWLNTFLNAQTLLFALSLYLFGFGFGSFQENVLDSLKLPRYFTFAFVLWFATGMLLKRQSRMRTFWGLPHPWRPLVAVLTVEVAAALFEPLRAFPMLSRVGVALVLSEAVWPKAIAFGKVFDTFAPILGVIFLSSFLAVVAFETGLSDLALVLLNPRVHPRFLLLFTFLAGIGIGFLTGTFSLAFFTLFAFLKSPQVALLKASLLDGLIAGCLLSPFSIFNLIPSVQFKLPLRQLILFRWQQLGIPLLIGAIIYLIGSLNSVAILRPATFVFCALVALAWRLKRRSWNLRRERTLLMTES